MSPDQNPPPYLEEVSPGIFAYIQLDGGWALNNPAFVVGQKAVTVIDGTSTEQRTNDLLAAIAETSSKAIDTLVNTHHHADHTFGNCVFGPEVTIVGQRACREMLLADADTAVANRRGLYPGVEWGEIEIVAPSVTFEDEAALYVDDLRIELIRCAPAHTTNDIIGWVPDRRLLFAGDLIFNEGTPFALQGSIAGWLSALDTLRSLDVEQIIPGHGAVCGPDAIDDVTAYLRWVQIVAQTGFEAGASPLEVARDTELGRFSEWNDTERLVGNLHRAYSELRGEALGVPLAFGPVWQEMIDYHGGPLSCLA